MPILNTFSFGCKSAAIRANHPAEHGILFDVVMATVVHSKRQQIFRPFTLSRQRLSLAFQKRVSTIANTNAVATFILGVCFYYRRRREEFLSCCLPCQSVRLLTSSPTTQVTFFNSPWITDSRRFLARLHSARQNT